MLYYTIYIYIYTILYTSLLFIGQKYRPPARQRRRPQDDGDDAHPSDVLPRGGLHARAPPCRDPVQDPGRHVRGHLNANGKHNNAYVLLISNNEYIHTNNTTTNNNTHKHNR